MLLRGKAYPLNQQLQKRKKRRQMGWVHAQFLFLSMGMDMTSVFTRFSTKCLMLKLRIVDIGIGARATSIRLSGVCEVRSPLFV